MSHRDSLRIEIISGTKLKLNKIIDAAQSDLARLAIILCVMYSKNLYYGKSEYE